MKFFKTSFKKDSVVTEVTEMTIRKRELRDSPKFITDKFPECKKVLPTWSGFGLAICPSTTNPKKFNAIEVDLQKQKISSYKEMMSMESAIEEIQQRMLSENEYSNIMNRKKELKFKKSELPF